MAGDRLTIKDVARAAGVGVGTVSRVLNNHKSVDPTVRVKVQAAIRTLNYEPDTQARDLRRGATSTVGMVVRDRSIRYMVDFVRAAQEILDQNGYSMTVAFSETKDMELKLLERGARKRLAGIMMTTACEDDPDLIAARERFQAPIVFLEAEVQGDYDMVNVGLQDGTHQAVDYLAALGHHRIALLTGDRSTAGTRNRITSFHAALARHGLPSPPELVRCGGQGSDVGLSDCMDLFRLQHPPTALLAGGLGTLTGMLRAAREARLSIPQDISIVGYGDSELAELATPAVTVVSWDWAGMGRAAARLLLERIQNHRIGRAISLTPTTLKIRESCAAVPQPAVRKIETRSPRPSGRAKIPEVRRLR
jgi:LacI family transcriptional regulator